MCNAAPPRRLDGWWRRLWCRLGFHIWGFVYCPACDQVDPLLRDGVDSVWAALSPEEQDFVVKRVNLILKDTGLSIEEL
jgi:hypothetical protein